MQGAVICEYEVALGSNRECQHVSIVGNTASFGFKLCLNWRHHTIWIIMKSTSLTKYDCRFEKFPFEDFFLQLASNYQS